MKGRRPKPTRLKLIDGNPGKRPLNANEPQPAAGLPSCPPHLDGKAKTLWRKLGRQLATLGLVTEVDATALELLCAAYAEYREADRVIQKEGLTYTAETENGQIIRPRPEVAIRADAWKRFMGKMTEFGLTPSSRSRLHAPPPDNEQDAYEQFLRGAGAAN